MMQYDGYALIDYVTDYVASNHEISRAMLGHKRRLSLCSFVVGLPESILNKLSVISAVQHLSLKTTKKDKNRKII